MPELEQLCTTPLEYPAMPPASVWLSRKLSVSSPPEAGDRVSSTPPEANASKLEESAVSGSFVLTLAVF